MSHDASVELVKKADAICVDYWKQMSTFKNSVVTELFDAGEIKREDFSELSEMTLGKKLRTSDEQFIYAGSIGLGALDIMVAYQMYENAAKMGLGTKVNLWDKPLWE